MLLAAGFFLKKLRQEAFEAFLPLIERIASDSFTSHDRDRLRDLAGFGSIFELSTSFNRMSRALNALCGERARSDLIHASHERKR